MPTFVTLFEDNFTRADENPLDPTNWSVPSGDGALQIVSDQCVVATPDGNGGGICNTSLPDDQWASITIGTVGVSEEIGVGIRESGVDSGYAAAIIGPLGDSTEVALGRSDHVIGTFTGTVSVGDVFLIYAQGDVITLTQNGTIIITGTDPTFTSGSAVISILDGADSYITDFKCGDFGGTMFFRLEGWVQNPIGQAIPDADVAILTQPADTTTEPGTPLAATYAASTSSSGAVSAASWSGQQIVFTLSGAPDDVLIGDNMVNPIAVGFYIEVSGASPSGYNGIWQIAEVDGLDVYVAAFTDPGAYVSGGTVATAVLPNPLSTDGNGYYFCYVAAAEYTVQVYGPTIDTQIYPDQAVDQGSGGGGGGVTSVGLDMPAEFDVANSPITGSDTFEVTWADESANLVFAGPASGGDDTPSFRSMVAADIPSLSYVTSVALTLSVPAFLNKSVTGSPVTSAGTLALAITLANENANTVFAGPSSGSAGPPTFRGLVPADQAIAPVTVSFSATPTFDASLSNSFSITLGGNVTSSTLSNATAGQIFVLKIIQDGTGGRTFVYPTNVKGGMLIGSAASAINTQAFWFDGTNAYALGPGAIN